MVPAWRRRIPERSQCCLRASGRSAPPRWSARCRSRPTSAPGSRSSTRCAPPCSRSVSASSPEHRRRSSPTRTTSRSSTPPGCTSNGHEAAQLYDDDIAHRAAFFLIDPTNPAEVLAFYRANVGAGRPPEVRAAMIEEAHRQRRRRGRVSAFATMCEVAQRFAGLARARLEHPGGARVRLRALGRTRASRTPAATRSRCRCVSCTWRGTSRSSSPPRAPRRRGPSSSVARAPRTSLGSPSSPCATSTSSSPSSTRRGCGSRRSRSSRFRSSGSPASRSTPRSRRSPRSPVSSRRGCASTRRAWPSSPRPPPGASASRRLP